MNNIFKPGLGLIIAILLIGMASCATPALPEGTPVQTLPATPLPSAALTATPEMTITSTTPTSESIHATVSAETPGVTAGDQNTQGTAVNAPELTYQQNLAIIPPPPLELTASAVSGGIKLAWNHPAPVIVPHHYTDAILFYKIYRRTESTPFVFLAQTTENTFLDKTATSGTAYYYTVTAQHENGIESGRPNEVTATP